MLINVGASLVHKPTEQSGRDFWGMVFGHGECEHCFKNLEFIWLQVAPGALAHCLRSMHEHR